MAELRLSTWGIKNPIPVALLFLAAVIGGAISYNFLPIKQFPNIVFPAVLVIGHRERRGAGGDQDPDHPARSRTRMAGIAGVRDIQSEISQGSSTTMVQFELGEDLQKVTDEVRQQVDQTRVNLPREIDPPTVQRLEIDSQPILTYAVASPDMSASQLSWFVDDTVSRALQAQQGRRPGLAASAGVDREINVIVDPDRLAAQGLTATAAQRRPARLQRRHPGRARSTSAAASRPCACWAPRRPSSGCATCTIPTDRRAFRQAVRRGRRRRRRPASRAASRA